MSMSIEYGPHTFIQEWLPSLPLHLDLYASFKIPTPTYGHMPILLNPDGSKMSKRHGDVQVADFVVCLFVDLVLDSIYLIWS